MGTIKLCSDDCDSFVDELMYSSFIKYTVALLTTIHGFNLFGLRAISLRPRTFWLLHVNTNWTSWFGVFSLLGAFRREFFLLLYQLRSFRATNTTLIVNDVVNSRTSVASPLIYLCFLMFLRCVLLFFWVADYAILIFQALFHGACWTPLISV